MGLTERSPWLDLERRVASWLRQQAGKNLEFRNGYQAIPGYPPDGFRADALLTGRNRGGVTATGRRRLAAATARGGEDREGNDSGEDESPFDGVHVCVSFSGDEQRGHDKSRS